MEGRMKKIETVSEQSAAIFKINVNGYLKDGFELVSAGKSPDSEAACGDWWAIVKKEDKDDGISD
jgi:hypothetical protein